MENKVNLNFNSFNTRGLGNGTKRRTIFQWVNKFHKGITLLQETHSTKSIEKQWIKEWGGQIFFNHGTAQSRGVAILIPADISAVINDSIIDEKGRILLLDLTFEDENLILMNIYAPTKDKPLEQVEFLNIIKDILDNYIDWNIIIGVILMYV